MAGALRRRVLTLLLAFLLFAASLLGYGITRARLGDAVAVPLPGLLWVSTAVLLLGGAALEVASRSRRRRVGAPSRTRAWARPSTLR